MKQIQEDFNSGELRVKEVPQPTLKPDGVLVRTQHSVVSAGTERSTIELGKKSLVGKAIERPDLVKQVLGNVRNAGLLPTYRAATAQLDTPIPLGYTCAGEVIAVGDNVTEFSVGETVACGGVEYANHSEVNYVPKNLCVAVPDGVPTDEAAYATLGAIAMQGIRRLDATPGERICVIGLGLVGQITIHILSAYGYPTLGLDIDPDAVESARPHLSAAATIGEDDTTAAAQAFTDGNGADGVIITAATDSDQPIELAGDLCRERGCVSVVGDVGLDVPREIYYSKELDIHISRSYGPGRYDRSYEESGLDYPIGHVRWTENRNMNEFLRLLESGKVNLDSVTTHVFDIGKGDKAYELILSEEAFTGVVIEYPDESSNEEGNGSVVAIEGIAPEETDASNITGRQGTDDDGTDESEHDNDEDKRVAETDGEDGQ